MLKPANGWLNPLLKEIKKKHKSIVAIMITGFGKIESAVEAVKQARLETEEEARAAEAADAARAQLPPGEHADADEASTGVVRRRGQATQPVNEAMVRSLDAARAAAPRNPAPVHDQDSHG